MPDKGSGQSCGPGPGLQRAPRRSEHTSKWMAHFRPPRSLLHCPCPIQKPNLFTEHQGCGGSSQVRPGTQVSQHSPPPKVPRLQPPRLPQLLLPLRPRQHPRVPGATAAQTEVQASRRPHQVQSALSNPRDQTSHPHSEHPRPRPTQNLYTRVEPSPHVSSLQASRRIFFTVSSPDRRNTLPSAFWGRFPAWPHPELLWPDPGERWDLTMGFGGLDEDSVGSGVQLPSGVWSREEMRRWRWRPRPGQQPRRVGVGKLEKIKGVARKVQPHYR